MKSIHCFKTINNNHYVYNSIKKQFLFCHPVLYRIITKWLESPEKLFKFLKDIHNEKSNSNRKIINFFYKKFLFLLENDFLNNKEVKLIAKTTIPPEELEKALIDTDQIVFEVTESCNLRCEYCGYGDWYWDHEERTNNHLNENVAFQLLKYFWSLWNTSNYFSYKKKVWISFYGGEPLCNFSLIKAIIKHVKQLNFPRTLFEFGIVTNGILLNRKYLDFFVEHDFTITISLDGNKDMNSHRLFPNGSSSYATVYNKIIMINEIYPEYFSRKVLFNAVLHNRNDVESILRFYDKNFKKVPLILPLRNIGIPKEKIKLFARVHKSFNNSLNNATNIDFVKHKMDMRFPSYEDKITFLHFCLDNTFWNIKDLLQSNYIEDYVKIPTGTCIPFKKKIFLTAKGKLLPCERIGHQYSLGTVSQDRVDLNINNISKLYELYFSKLKPQCEKCYIFNLCKQCAFDIEGLMDEPNCNQFTDHDSFHSYLANCIQLYENDPKLYEKMHKDVIVRY